LCVPTAQRSSILPDLTATQVQEADARMEATNIFKQDGVDIEQLRKRLNNMQRHLDNPRVPAQNWSKNVSDSKKIHVSMASLVAAACGYDALCAGVNQSIGNAFKEEAQTIFESNLPIGPPGSIHDVKKK